MKQLNSHIALPLLSGLFALALTVVLQSASLAAIENVQFDDPKIETRYQQLIAELRCLVCQNQNLADSNAELAKDLRRKTAEMLRAGKSDDEILTFMRDRYGDFILYRPPFSATTAALWVGPFVLLLVAAFGILLTIKRRQENEMMRSTETHDEAQRIKIRNILATAPDLSKPSDSGSPEEKE